MPLYPPWEPARDEAGAATWAAPAPEAALHPVPGGLRYTRGGVDLLLPAEAADHLRWELRLGDSTLVARLEPPALVPAGGRVTLWLALPLVQALAWKGRPEAMDRVRPGVRKTVLGPVNAGQVYPAARSRVLTGPDDPTLAPWTEAAVRVLAHNRSEVPLVLRRVPVHEPSLSLWRRADHLAAGDVGVTLEREGEAEARCVAGEPPPGWDPVEESAPRPVVPALSWLLEATRSSVDFQP